jgi:hypothetical protein
MTDIQGRSLELAGSLGRPLFWLVVISAVPFAGMAVALWVAQAHGAHDAGNAIFLVPVILVGGLLLIARALSRAGVRVDHGMLIVNTGFGSKQIALSDLRAHGLSIVNLNERTELKPSLRRWGTSLPGFHGGWFRLRNREKAVCLLLQRDRVSYLRSNDGTSLLLSLQHPETLRALLGPH